MNEVVQSNQCVPLSSYCENEIFYLGHNILFKVGGCLATFALCYFTSFLCIMNAGVGAPSAPNQHQHPTVTEPWGVCRYIGTFFCRAQPASCSATLGSRNQFRPQDFSKVKP